MLGDAIKETVFICSCRIYMDKGSERSVTSLKDKEPAREYGCPCGKTYLSYPALFTHVKQKHEGKAPGKLIKPKSGKIRGRPKTRIEPQDKELQEIMGLIQKEMNTLMQENVIEYQHEFERSEGNSTCQDAASMFLDQFENDTGGALLHCFMNELKALVDAKFGPEYWAKQKPADIIELSNELYLSHDHLLLQFPITKEALKELIFNFFEWLYANKFTDHRLLKKAASEENTVANQ